MKVKGALLWGIVVAAIVGIPLGVTPVPTAIVAPLDFTTFAAPLQTAPSGVMGLVEAFTTPALLLFAFSLMMSDFFDTMGTAMAVAKQGEFLTEDGKVEDIRPILIVDSIAAAVGGFFGASSITTFVESSSGAADGGGRVSPPSSPACSSSLPLSFPRSSAAFRLQPPAARSCSSASS